MIGLWRHTRQRPDTDHHSGSHQKQVLQGLAGGEMLTSDAMSCYSDPLRLPNNSDQMQGRKAWDRPCSHHSAVRRCQICQHDQLSAVGCQR